MWVSTDEDKGPYPQASFTRPNGLKVGTYGDGYSSQLFTGLVPDMACAAMSDLVPPEKLTWDHIYLLGWIDHEGQSYLTTWEGNLPMLEVIVYGVSGLSIPLWDASVPPGARLEAVPEGKDGQGWARLHGGLLALAWYVAEGITRKAPELFPGERA